MWSVSRALDKRRDNVFENQAKACVGYRGPRQTDGAAMQMCAHLSLSQPEAQCDFSGYIASHIQRLKETGNVTRASLSACHGPKTWSSNRESALVRLSLKTLERLNRLAHTADCIAVE